MSLPKFFPREALVKLDHRIQLVIIGIVVGILGGFAALGLNFSLKIFAEYLKPYHQDFFMIFLPAAGILLTVLLLKYFFRDYGGHGVPEVILSVSTRGGWLKLRSSLSRLVGTLLTISGGGSSGPEAPVALSGASIGSNIATYFKANDKIRIAATGSGAAAAIASIFNAPLAGFIFSMEVILGEWNRINMLPVAIASVTGTIISRFFNGNQILFEHQLLEIGFNDMVAVAGFSLFMGGLSILFIKVLKKAQVLFQKFFRNILIKGAMAGLLVGVMVYFFPQVRGEGYRVVENLIQEKFSAGLLVLLSLIILKLLATSVTLGGGGAGGIFAPSLVIGSLSGYFYYHLLIVFFPASFFSGSGVFALCGMAGMLSGALHAPLTGIFLIVEITGGYDVILPLLLVSFLTVTLAKLVEKDSIYHYEVAEKGFLRRPRTDARILADIDMEELLEKDFVPVYPEMLLVDVIPAIIQSNRNYFPVVDKQTGNYQGIVDLNAIKSYIFDPELRHSIIVEEVIQMDLPSVSIKDNMIDILHKFDMSHAWSLPVISDKKFIGLVSKSRILDHYRKELKAQTED